MTLDMISNRHRRNLGGRLTDSRLPAKVSVLVDADTARYPTAQHLTWMLLNLLARQSYEIREIELALPGGIPEVQRLSPLISTASDLKESLREGISRINPTVLVSETTVASHVTVRVGPGALAKADFALATTAYGWSGYVGQVPVDLIGEDEHPVGAYVAASLCAGEIFKFIRGMRAECGTFAHQLWVDAASLHVSDEVPDSRGPLLPVDLHLVPAVVAGIGAVGNGMLHTLYPLAHLRGEFTLLDGDPKGIDVTNLNRCVLFGLSHTSAPKASAASELFAGSGLIMHSVDEHWQSWYSRKADRPLDLVISAVDKNSARHAIQNAYPRLVLGASTNEMRTQVNLYDVLHGGLCLRCRNPIEEAMPDDVVIARLRRLSPKERLIEAERAGIDASTLETFLSDPHAHCGMISGETLQRFAGEDTQGEWSVGFVSLLSGVLLAAEYLKLSLDPSQVALDAQLNTFKFQFWRPDSAETNKIYHTPPEQACFCQSTTSRSGMMALWGG